MEPVRALRRALRARIDDVRTRHVSLPGVLDFRSAVRATCASPVVSITSVLALGVGIALATAGFNPRDPSRADGVYVPLPSKFATVRLAWLTDGHPLALAPAVHEAVRRLPIEARVQYSRTLADNLTKSAAIVCGIGYGLVVLGVLTLVMTCTAIHAIVAFSLAQRRRELAIRVALGAGASAVLRALLGRTARQLAAGAILGALLALAISRLIDDVLPLDVPRRAYGGQPAQWRSS